jgi:hypothetical protein
MPTTVVCKVHILTAVAICLSCVAAGFEQLSAGGWKQLARAWPRLTILRLGGTAAATSEAVKALQHILPGILPPQPAAASAGKAAAGSMPLCGAPFGAAAVDSPAGEAGNAADAAAGGKREEGAAEGELGSWEDAFASDSEQEDEAANNTAASSQPASTAAQQSDSWTASSINTSTSRHTQQLQQQAAAAGDCRLKELHVLVWPDVPAEAVQLVQQRCPRVAVNPSLLPDAVSGQLPPPEVDPGVSLDAPAMALVGPQALQVRRSGVLCVRGLPLRQL